MSTYTLQWLSTPYERYETTMKERAEALARKAPGVRLIGSEGGASDTVAENLLIVQARTLQVVVDLADALDAEVDATVEVQDKALNYRVVYTSGQPRRTP